MKIEEIIEKIYVKHELMESTFRSEIGKNLTASGKELSQQISKAIKREIEGLDRYKPSNGVLNKHINGHIMFREDLLSLFKEGG